MEISAADIVLCEFYFSDLKQSKNRPVLIFKDNLPYGDFVGIPISSQIQKLHADEHKISHADFCSGRIPKDSKLLLRKPFVISKTAIIKKYGTLNQDTFKRFQKLFCHYF
ncbi:MAG: type II toxin-antitoxin system PemK/MazF family toxin [Gammaproteobacteria bacterium]|nr:MAG: type II toxin-antitoxin system PemK/MazF family toxin [Gammaproteobacteria bacterium]